MNGAPGPLLALCGGALFAALLTSQPLVLAVLFAGLALAVWRSPGPRRLTLGLCVSSIVFWALINPFVAVEGNLVLFAGPDLLQPFLDLEVTMEEIVYGAFGGVRIAAVICAFGLFLARCDPDRLTDGAARIAPRSALAAALAARLAPTLARDASALADAARARGLALSSGGKLERARAHGRLLPPLFATSLERGLEVAEAMTARGYGSGPRTALELPRGRSGLPLYLAGAVVLASVLALRWAGEATMQYYPTLGDPLTAPAILAALACACALGLAIRELAQWS